MSSHGWFFETLWKASSGYEVLIVPLKNDVIQYKWPMIGQYTNSNYQWQASMHFNWLMVGTIKSLYDYIFYTDFIKYNILYTKIQLKQVAWGLIKRSIYIIMVWLHSLLSYT